MVVKMAPVARARVKLPRASLSHGDHNEGALTAAEKTAGNALFCCAHAQSDLVIAVREVQGAGDLIDSENSLPRE
jgi:hypothetical protein